MYSSFSILLLFSNSFLSFSCFSYSYKFLVSYSLILLLNCSIVLPFDSNCVLNLVSNSRLSLICYSIWSFSSSTSRSRFWPSSLFRLYMVYIFSRAFSAYILLLFASWTWERSEASCLFISATSFLSFSEASKLALSVSVNYLIYCSEIDSCLVSSLAVF